MKSKLAFLTFFDSTEFHSSSRTNVRSDGWEFQVSHANNLHIQTRNCYIYATVCFAQFGDIHRHAAVAQTMAVAKPSKR